MSFKDIIDQQKEGMRAQARYGLIGLHLVSGPLVGLAMGYGLDCWLKTGPWLLLIFLFIGICAGFLNVWRDTRELLRKMDNERSGRMVDRSNKTG